MRVGPEWFYGLLSLALRLALLVKALLDSAFSLCVNRGEICVDLRITLGMSDNDAVDDEVKWRRI